MKWLNNNPMVLLVLACLAIFFVHLDALIINIMEARNFVTAREMINDGNWILTTLNGEPRYQKPPLPTWLTAFSAAIFGLKNVIALRLPAAIMALVLILFSYKFSIKHTQHKAYALVSALVLATSFYVVSSGRDGQWDIFTHGFMMVAIYFIYKFFTEDSHRYRNIIIAALFVGCSFLSKGPVSMYALMLPFLISFGIVYRFKEMKSRWLPIFLFLVIALVISGSWYWYTYTFDAEAVAAITKRETSNWTGYNVRPFYYYWSFFTQSGVWSLIAVIALLYPYLKDRVFNKKAYLLCVLWTLGSLLLLSIIPEKKSRYLLPVLIPLALTIGFYMEYLFRRFKELKNKWETIPVYFNFGLIAAIGLVFPVGGYLFLKDQLTGGWFWFISLSVVLFAIGFFILRFLIRKEIRPVFYLTIAFIAAIICFGMPLAKVLTVNPEYKSLSELNDWQSESHLEVYEYGGFTPEMIWAYGKPIKVLSQDATIEIPSGEGFGILIAEENLVGFEKTFANYKIEKITRYDMNPNAPGTRTHRPRLWRDLYLVTKN